jgi:hypothetical protein
MRSPCRCESSPLTPPSSACSPARSTPLGSCERAGAGLDPEVAACLVNNAEEILAPDPEGSVWDEVLAGEPRPQPALRGGEAIDRALAAMGNFADPISPFFTGHSAGVAELAGKAPGRCRLDAAATVAVRRAALVQDLGRVAIGARTWQKPGPLSAHEWEQVRLHPYQTERVLAPFPFLGELAQIAGATTNASTAPATTAARMAPTSRCRLACSPRRMPTGR